jgi:protein-S-isoprenylcysteine O-methyltransferase Ste14
LRRLLWGYVEPDCSVRPEEAYLSEKFGEAYRHYTTTVRRYL